MSAWKEWDGTDKRRLVMTVLAVLCGLARWVSQRNDVNNDCKADRLVGQTMWVTPFVRWCSD
jgi:hypothetical protein